eukprot:g2437.t1
MRDHSNSHYTTTSYGLADDNVNAAEAVNKDRGDAAVKAEVDRIDSACASCNAFALVPLASKQSSLASTAGFEQSTQQPAEAGPWWLCVHCTCDVCWGAELGANLRQAVKREKDSEVQRRREVRRREQRRLSAPVLLPRRRASSPIRKKIKDGTHDAVGALTHKILTSCKSRSLHLRYWQRRLRELHIVAIQRVIRLRLLRVYHLPRAAGWSKTLQRARDDYDEERFAVTHVCQWRSAVFGQVCGKTGFYSAADVRKHYEEHEAEQRRQEMKVQKGFARLEAEREFLSQLRDKRKTMLRSSKQANSIAKAKIIEGRRAEGAQDMCRRVGVLEKLVGGNHAQMWQPVWRRFIIRLGKGVLELEPEHVCHRPDGDHGHDAAGISRRVTIMLSRGDTLVSHLSDVARRRFRRDFAFEVVTKQVQVDTDSGTTTDGAGGVERAVILAASSAEQARSWTADILQAMATPPHGALPGFLPGVWRAAQRGDVNTLQVWAIKGGAELLTRPNAHNCTPLFYAALSIAAAVDKCCCCGIDGDGTSDCASFAGKGFGDLCAVRRSVAAMELILDHAPEADPRQSNGTGHSAQSVLESCTSRLSKKQKDCEGLVTAAVTGVLQAASSACYGALECCRKRAQKLHQQQPSSTGITTYNGPACCTQSTSAIEAAPFAAQHGAEMLNMASATPASPQIDTAQKTITTLGLPREAMRKPVCGRAFELEPFDRTSQQKPAAAVQRLTRPLSAGVFRSASSHVPAQQPLPAHASVAPMHIETVMCRADVVAAFDGSIARAGVHAAENRARQELRAGLEVLEQQATTQKQSATRAWRRPRSATLWRSPGNDPNWQPQEFSGAPAAMAFTKPAGDAAQAHWRRAPFDSKPRGVKGDARAVLAQMRPGGTERRALLHMSSAQKRKFFDRKLAERAHMVKATAPPPLDPHEGDAVECRWRGKKKWYPAVVLADRSDGKFDVKFEDGEIERGVVAMCLRRRNNAGSRQQAYWYRVTGDSMPATVHDTGTTPGLAKRGGRHPPGFSSDAVKLSAARGIEASTALVGGVRLGHDVIVVVQVHHNSMWLGIKLHGDPLSLRVDGDAPTRKSRLSAQGEVAEHGANEDTAAHDARAFSSTTLRPALALALLRMAFDKNDRSVSPQPVATPRNASAAGGSQSSAAGILLDPMCGSGTICAQAQSRAAGTRSNCMFSIAADIDDHAIALAAHNLRARQRCDVLQCDARRLPLRSGCIDAIVTDMPFGKRMGDGSTNRELYPAVVHEVARCLKNARGVAVMLSASRRGAILRNACKAEPCLRWVRGNMLQMGGLQALAAVVTKKPDVDEHSNYLGTGLCK